MLADYMFHLLSRPHLLLLFMTNSYELNAELKAFGLIEMRFLLYFTEGRFQFQLISLALRIKVQTKFL